MATTKSWIDAARPRTLPLALSGIIMGSGLAWHYGLFDFRISILAVVTATFIQVFSNFANDFGDSRKGTDNQHRVGPPRTVQSGAITHLEMQRGMWVIGTLSFLSGLLLVYLATWTASRTAFYLFVLLGILSLLAAYFYTAGKRSYGYIGLGDVFVFLFFGLLPVTGVFYLNTGFIHQSIFLPAMSIGFFSTAVLNLNNMRDIVNDRRSGKITIPVRIGPRYSRYYHTALISGGWLTTLLYTLLIEFNMWHWVYVIALPIYLKDVIKINSIGVGKELDPFLKRLAISTLIFTLLFVTGITLATI